MQQNPRRKNLTRPKHTRIVCTLQASCTLSLRGPGLSFEIQSKPDPSGPGLWAGQLLGPPGWLADLQILGRVNPVGRLVAKLSRWRPLGPPFLSFFGNACLFGARFEGAAKFRRFEDVWRQLQERMRCFYVVVASTVKERQVVAVKMLWFCSFVCSCAV